MQNSLRLIAIGIALSHADRVKKVRMLNDMIDSTLDTIRSSSDVDGMPRAIGGISDPVGQRAAKVERLEEERDLEQNRINAVEWATQYVKDMFRDDEADDVVDAIILYLNRKKDEALLKVEVHGDISQTAFFRAKTAYLQQIVAYLKLGVIR